MEPTHEPEITEPVDLCTPDGKFLNPQARGWSRRPLHTANLRGKWGRTKRWDYWAVLAGDLVFGLVYADVDYLGLATVWWANLKTGEQGGHDVAVPFARGIDLPDKPGASPLIFRNKKFRMSIVDEEAFADKGSHTHIRIGWREPDGRDASLDARIELPEGHESMSVVIPWSDKTFQYTTKDQARPASGTFTLGDQVFEFGVGAKQREGLVTDEAWGVLDVGRGRWPYSITWNWGGGSGYATTGERIGIQIGAKWTDGTGFTENGIMIDGRLHKIGRQLHWEYSWDHPMKPWHVTDSGGAIDIVLTPRLDKYGKTDAGVLRTEVHQMFGTWTGTVRGEDGKKYRVEGIQEFAEESRNRW